MPKMKPIALLTVALAVAAAPAAAGAEVRCIPLQTQYWDTECVAESAQANLSFSAPLAIDDTAGVEAHPPLLAVQPHERALATDRPDARDSANVPTDAERMSKALPVPAGNAPEERT